jgi:nucleotide-binding universal stress UspA family protein
MHLLVLQNILAAVELDGSSATALATAAELARLSGAQLHVLHAAPSTGAGAERALASAVREAAPWAAAATRVEAGPPAEVISRDAERCGADVIVLGPHRGSPGESRALGGTADRVVRAAEVPCLVVAAPLRLPLRHVLAPVDLSESARGALGVALAWASALRLPGAGGDLRTCLTVLHVARPGEDAGVSDAVRQEVEGVRGRVEGFAGVRVEEVVEHADHAAAAIVARAAAEGADLLVLGTRGQSGAGEMLGSVSSEVVRESGCPVLLVPAALGRRYADDVVAGG